ncbi:hypothetical protein TNCV_1521481 [Trichonephila clavipes]|nr:hypothetical protein TNCV_1521481 [Trichonephila clavipes]
MHKKTPFLPNRIPLINWAQSPISHPNTTPKLKRKRKRKRKKQQQENTYFLLVVIEPEDNRQPCDHLRFGMRTKPLVPLAYLPLT